MITYLMLAMLYNKKNDNNGFAVLYAVLVASVVAIGGLVLSNIIFKQLVLSGVGQSSQISYYAADVGRACARYWEGQGNFGYTEDTWSGSSVTHQFTKGDVGQITCLDYGSPITPAEDQSTVGNSSAGQWTFKIDNINRNSCVRVSIYNDINQFKSTSVGYNNPNCDSNNRLVLRRVKDFFNHQ